MLINNFFNASQKYSNGSGSVVILYAGSRSVKNEYGSKPWLELGSSRSNNLASKTKGHQ